MVDAIGFTGVSALISSISYRSGATTMYFFSSAIYPPVISFKRGPTKLPRTGASKGAKKAPPSCTKISLFFFFDVFGFTSFRILSRFLLIFLFSQLLTLIFLLMILMVHSQITLIVSRFKCSTILFSLLWKNLVMLSIFFRFCRFSTIVKLQIILFLFEYIIYIHFADLPKCCFVLETFPQCLVSIKHQVGMWG